MLIKPPSPSSPRPNRAEGSGTLGLCMKVLAKLSSRPLGLLTETVSWTKSFPIPCGTLTMLPVELVMLEAVEIPINPVPKPPDQTVLFSKIPKSVRAVEV